MSNNIANKHNTIPVNNSDLQTSFLPILFPKIVSIKVTINARSRETEPERAVKESGGDIVLALIQDIYLRSIWLYE